MTIPRFLQIHSLHSYPAALLNRDDSGLAKRMPFGGATRTRVSSQCLKRHWRDPEDEKKHEYALHRIEGAAKAVRSRNIVERKVMQPLTESGENRNEVLEAMKDAFNVGVYGSSGESEQGRQPLLLGLPEVEYLQVKAKAIYGEYPDDKESASQVVTGLLVTDEQIRQANGSAKSKLRSTRKKALEMFGNEEKPNFEAFRKSATLPGGLIGALFGRMVTSDPGANIEAAVHVAHAFTVHAEESESDYFSVVDDLQGEDEDAGAAHIGDVELTAGLFYGYVVVDVPGLVSNLEGCQSADWQNEDRELAAKVIEHLIHLIATVSPGAKLGSTAPYAYADLMLVEAGSRQPRSLANAFRDPVKAQVGEAATALSAHLSKLDKAYGASESRRIMSVEECEIANAESLCLDDLALWAAGAVRDGKAE